MAVGRVGYTACGSEMLSGFVLRYFFSAYITPVHMSLACIASCICVFACLRVSVVNYRQVVGEFCVAVAPATRTAGILTQLVKGAGC